MTFRIATYVEAIAVIILFRRNFDDCTRCFGCSVVCFDVINCQVAGLIASAANFARSTEQVIQSCANCRTDKNAAIAGN